MHRYPACAGLAAACLALIACSSGKGPRSDPGFDRRGAERQQNGPVMTTEQAARLIDTARTLRRDEGCTEAVPVYRVIAGYGRNFEIAQYELAECLLQDDPSALDHREAMVWLERAAMAGHPASQRKLAETSLTDEAYGAALAWALTFNAENDNALVPRTDFSSAFIGRAQSHLSAEEISAAEAFAEDFSPDYMPAFRLGGMRQRDEEEEKPDDGVERIGRPRM